MANAICFNCGSDKAGAFLTCFGCGTTPQTDSERALSLVLSNHLSSKSHLVHYSHELRNHLKLSIPSDALAKAHDALRDPRLIAMVSPHSGSDTSAQPTPTTATSGPVNVTPRAGARRKLTTTALHQTPFAILGVTIHDDRRRIVELAEEKSLELDHDVCQQARSALTNPRTRLSAEIAWLPRISPHTTSQLLEGLLHDPMAGPDWGPPSGRHFPALHARNYLTLAYVNLLAAGLVAVDSEYDPVDLARYIEEIADLQGALNPEVVLRDINEDRAISGFPEVRTVDKIEAELAERKRYYCSAIKDALDRLPSTTLVRLMTDMVEHVTSGGVKHAPELIDDLVDSYEVEAQDFLRKEAENVQKLISAIRDSASSGASAVDFYLDKLDTVTRNWDKVAQPIQLSAKARGIDHEASRDIAYRIRSLAIDLFNTHDMLSQSQRLMGLLQEVFAEVPEVNERVEEDVDALAEIDHERKQAVVRREEWAREITYHAEIGSFFKEPLIISPDGICWKGQVFPLDSITRVRWGGIRHSVNGVPTGTTFTIAFGDRRSEAVVELKKEDIYGKFVDKLWRAVGFRLLVEMLEALKAGQHLYFGDAVLHDDGVTLVKRRFLGANENVRCTWGQVQIWNADGSFCIGSKNDKKTSVSISYIDVANTHILEHAVRMAFKKPGLRRLSDLWQ